MNSTRTCQNSHVLSRFLNLLLMCRVHKITCHLTDSCLSSACRILNLTICQVLNFLYRQVIGSLGCQVLVGSCLSSDHWVLNLIIHQVLNFTYRRVIGSLSRRIVSSQCYIKKTNNQSEILDNQ